MTSFYVTSSWLNVNIWRNTHVQHKKRALPQLNVNSRQKLISNCCLMIFFLLHCLSFHSHSFAFIDIMTYKKEGNCRWVIESFPWPWIGAMKILRIIPHCSCPVHIHFKEQKAQITFSLCHFYYFFQRQNFFQHEN